MLAAPAPGVAASELNRVVLRVNDRIATLYDYETMKQERLAALSRAQMPEAELQQQLAGLGVAVMKELFDEMLVLSRADQLNMRAEESDILRSIEQTKQGFGITSEEEFERALASNGMTRESFREQITKNLLLRQVMGREVYSQVAVEEEDLRRYYQQNPDEFREPATRLLKEVVVLESGRSPEELRRVAEQVRSGMLTAEADSVIAASEAAGESTGWIDLGWVEVGDLDTQLESALVDLGPGDVSQPTQARGGLHIIQVVDSRPARLREFRDVSQRIEARLTDERFQDALETYMKDLEAKAYVESDPPPDAAGFRSGRTSDRSLDLLDGGLAGSEPAEASASDETEEGVSEPPR